MVNAAICGYMLGAILGTIALNWYVVSQPGQSVFCLLYDACLFGTILSRPAIGVVSVVFGGFVAYLIMPKTMTNNYWCFRSRVRDNRFRERHVARVLSAKQSINFGACSLITV